jgi:hypothetical protein
MNIIDHGAWEMYSPHPSKRDEFELPHGAMFARRISDGVDWYDYVAPSNKDIDKPEEKTLKKNFSDETVKATVYWHPDFKKHIVGSAVTDPTLLFPPNQQVIEITDYTGSDPATDFNGKVYDAATGSFTVLVLSPAPKSGAKKQ